MKDRAKQARVIATYVVVGGMVLIFLFDIAVTLLSNHYARRYPVERYSAAREEYASGAGARIHFLNTGNSDCVLLESGGRFALVDSGWGSENPIAQARRPGHEQRVLDYLKRVAAGEDGTVTLDFVLPTHYHYDHAGGFLLILSDPAIHVNTVYLSPREGQAPWYVPEIRQGIEETALARGFTLEEELPTEPFLLGEMTVQFLNTEEKQHGENDNSVVALLTYGDFRALLAGDITARWGLEKEIAQAAGPVDLLKLPHHG